MVPVQGDWLRPLLASPPPQSPPTFTLLCVVHFCSYTQLSLQANTPPSTLHFPHYCSRLQACCHRAYLYVNKQQLKHPFPLFSDGFSDGGWEG